MACLSTIFQYAKNKDVEFGGFKVDNQQKVTISLNSLVVTASYALSIQANKPHTIAWPDTDHINNAKETVIACSLCYNDEANMGMAYSDDKENVLANALVPTKYNQAKFIVPPKFHISRIYEWYCTPKASVPKELNDFVNQTYGIPLSEIGHCIMLLWIVGELKNPFLQPSIFRNITNWSGSSTEVFLRNFVTEIDQYKRPWTQEPTCNDIQSGLPILYRYPLVHLGQIENEEVYSIPVPKLLFTHMEDTFYWMCFDYFKNKENGRPDNTFTIWFGKAFEEYGIKLLRKIAKEKFFKDLRYLGNENKPSLDAAEILHETATFFEFKNRRLTRQNCLKWNKTSEADMKEAGEKIVQQIVKFSASLKSNSNIWTPNIKKMSFIVVTPYHWHINTFIRNAGWFKTEMETIKSTLALKQTPELLFLNIFDLEEWGNGNHTKGIPLNKYLKEYMKSSEYPYVDFANWITKAYPKLGDNPTIDQSVEQLHEQIKSKYNFR